jgi:hypothetical protein
MCVCNCELMCVDRHVDPSVMSKTLLDRLYKLYKSDRQVQAYQLSVDQDSHNAMTAPKSTCTSLPSGPAAPTSVSSIITTKLRTSVPALSTGGHTHDRPMKYHGSASPPALAASVSSSSLLPVTSRASASLQPRVATSLNPLSLFCDRNTADVTIPAETVPTKAASRGGLLTRASRSAYQLQVCP